MNGNNLTYWVLMHTHRKRVKQDKLEVVNRNREVGSKRIGRKTCTYL